MGAPIEDTSGLVDGCSHCKWANNALTKEYFESNGSLVLKSRSTNMTYTISRSSF